MTTKVKRVIAAAVLLVAAVAVTQMTVLQMWQQLLIYLVPYLIVGYDVIAEAAENALHGNLFNEDFLMCIATAGALCIGFLPDTASEFPEAVFVMLFFQIGEIFEDYASGATATL